MKIKRLPDWLQFLIDFLSDMFGDFLSSLAGIIGFKKCQYCKKWFWLNIDVKTVSTRYYNYVTICEYCIKKGKLERQ